MGTEKKMGGATIPFVTEDGATVQFHVLEQTKFYGIDYLLVTQGETSPEETSGGAALGKAGSDEISDEDEMEVYILKDLSGADSAEAVYEIVEDEEELRAVAGLFEELLEDVDIVEGDD